MNTSTAGLHDRSRGGRTSVAAPAGGAASDDGDVLSRTWGGHPRGMFLVAFTELWERFSYWGMAGLLVLYLTAAPAAGGWGWEQGAAMKFYGWYGGLAFMLPVAGAWLANNWLGERRCILWGGIAIVAGHLLLSSPLLGFGSFHLPFWMFLLALLLIVAGTGLLKPTISSIVAQLYPGGGARRDEGFAYFFVAIYIGALLGALVAGFFGERIGWHYGLAVAGSGMAFGLTCYLALQNAWLGDVGRAPMKSSAAGTTPLTREDEQRVLVIGVQGLFTVLYAAGFYQMFGLLNLYARDHLDRDVGSFEVPTTWMQTINLWAFFIFVPVLAWIWRKLARRQRNPSASYKLAWGLGMLAAGYAILAVAESVRGDGKPELLWLVATYALFGLGDALVWPHQISLTSKLAPPQYSALLIGGWYVCIGLGTWLTGYVGALIEQHAFRNVFVGLAAGCAGAALLLAALTPLLRTYMHGAERLDGPMS